MDEYLLIIMGQVFVHGRIPAHRHGASIRTVDEYPVRNVGQVFVRGRIAPIRRLDFPSYSSNLYVFVRGVQYLKGG